MPYEVYFLEIVTKNDLEDTERLKAKVLSQMKCWCKPGFHAKRLIKFVAVTAETLEHFHDRLLPTLTDLLESGSIERFVLHSAPAAVITDHGKMDALAHYLRLGQIEAADRNKSQRLRERERWQRRI